MTGNDLIRILQSLNADDRAKKVKLWDRERVCNVEVKRVIHPCEEFDFTEIQ